VAAFRSTLQEARDADLLLHVIDAADPERSERIAQVDQVLESIGAGNLRQVAVYNKIDRTGEEPRIEYSADGLADRVWLSAQTGAGIGLLHEALLGHFGRELARCQVRVPARAGRARARFHQAGAVIAERAEADGGFELEVWMRRPDIERICREEGLDPPVAAPCMAESAFLQSTRFSNVGNA
jgi:GTP-binding protein HflX